MNTPIAHAQKSATQVMQGMQKLVQLNMEVAKASFAEATKTAQAVMAVKTPEEFSTLCAAEFKAAPDKAAAYGRQLRDIFTTASQR
jgi:phasin family protein